MGTLVNFVSSCRTWTLRVLGRQSCDDAAAVAFTQDLTAAMHTRDMSAAAEAAGALEAAASTQSPSSAALLQTVQAQPCAVAAAIVSSPHLLQTLLDAALDSRQGSFSTAAADALLVLTAGHRPLAGLAPTTAAALELDVAGQSTHDATAAADVTASKAQASTGAAADGAAKAEAARCCCKAAGQLLELLSQHVQLLVEAVERSHPCSITAGVLLSRTTAGASNGPHALEPYVGKLLQLACCTACSTTPAAERADTTAQQAAGPADVATHMLQAVLAAVHGSKAAASAALLELQPLLTMLGCQSNSSTTAAPAAAQVLLRLSDIAHSHSFGAALLCDERVNLQLLQLVAKQHESPPPVTADTAVLAGTAADARHSFRSSTCCVNLFYEGSYPVDSEQQQSREASQACDAAFTAARSTPVGAALAVLAAAARTCPDAVSSALLQCPQGLPALLQILCSDSSGSSSSSRSSSSLASNQFSDSRYSAFMALSIVQAVITVPPASRYDRNSRIIAGTSFNQRGAVLTALAAEGRLEVLLQGLLLNSRCAASLLSSIGETSQLQQELPDYVELLLSILCSEHALDDVRAAAATAVASIGHIAEVQQAVAEAMEQHTVGVLVQQLQRSSSSAVMMSAVAWVVEALAATPEGQQLLLPFADQLAAVATQRHAARYDSSTVDVLALRAAAWVFSLAGLSAAGKAAADRVLHVVLEQFKPLLSQPQQQLDEQQERQRPAVEDAAVHALQRLVQSESGRQVLLHADTACSQDTLLTLLQLISCNQHTDEAVDADLSGDDEDNSPVLDDAAVRAAATEVVEVLLGTAACLEWQPLGLRQLYKSLSSCAGLLLDCGMWHMDQLLEGTYDDVAAAMLHERRCRLVALALVRAAQIADVDGLIALMQHVGRIVAVPLRVQDVGWFELVCEWCAVFGHLIKASEKLQLPSSSWPQDVQPLVGEAAALLVQNLALDQDSEVAAIAAAARALGVFAGSMVGRQAIATHSNDWGHVTDCLLDNEAAIDNWQLQQQQQQEVAAEEVECNHPVSDMLAAAARRAAAAGEQPPFLQKLLSQLQRVQDDIDVVPGDFPWLRAHIAWSAAG